MAYSLYVVPDLRPRLTLQQAHDGQKCDRVHHRARSHAVNKPLCQRVAQAEPRRHHAAAMVSIVAVASRLLQVLELDVSLLLLLLPARINRVRRKPPLEKLLPDEVGRRGQHREDEEPDQL